MRTMTIVFLGLAAATAALARAGPVTTDPVKTAVDSVPSYRIYSVAQHESMFTSGCQQIGATICRPIHRFANDPGAAAREVDQAMHTACTTAGGTYDAKADQDIIAALEGFHAGGPFEAVHSCRTGTNLSGIEVHVEDFGASVDRQPQDAITRLLGDRRSRYEALTTVIGYTAEGLSLHKARQAVSLSIAQMQNCRANQSAALREGAMTTAGLLVEVRQQVALVQPNQGPAVWLPVDRLRLIHPPVPCDNATSTVACALGISPIMATPDVKHRGVPA